MSSQPPPTQRLGALQRSSVEAAQRYPALSPRAAHDSGSSGGRSNSSSLSLSHLSSSVGSSPFGVPLSSPRSRASASDLPFSASGRRAPHASVSPRDRSPVAAPTSGFEAAAAIGVSLSSSLSRQPIHAFKQREARAAASGARASLKPSATVVHARSNLSSMRIAPTAPERSPNPANYSPSPGSAPEPSPRSAAAAAAAFQGRLDRATASSSAAVAPPVNRPLIAALLRTSPPAAVSLSETAAFQSRLDHVTSLRASQDASAAAAAAATRPFSPSSSALAHALRTDAALPSPPEPRLLEAMRSRILVATSQPRSKALMAAKQQQADDELRASQRRSNGSSGHNSFNSSNDTSDRPLTTRELDFDDQQQSPMLEQEQGQSEERKYPPFGARILPDTDSPPSRSTGVRHDASASPVLSAPSSAAQSPSLVAAKSPSSTHHTPGLRPQPRSARSPSRSDRSPARTPVSVVQSHSSYFVSSPAHRRQRLQHAQTQTPPSAQSRQPKGILHGRDLTDQHETEDEDEEDEEAEADANADAALARPSSSSDDDGESDEAQVATRILRARAKAASAARESALRRLAAKEAREAEHTQAQQHPTPVRTVRIEQPAGEQNDAQPQQQQSSAARVGRIEQPGDEQNSAQPEQQQQPQQQPQQRQPSPSGSVRIGHPEVAASSPLRPPHTRQQTHPGRLSPTPLRLSAAAYVPPPLVHATPLSPPPQRSPSPPAAVATADAGTALPVTVAVTAPQLSSPFAADELEGSAEGEVEAEEEEEEEEPPAAIQPFAQPAQPIPAAAVVAVKEPSPPSAQTSPPKPQAQQPSPPQQLKQPAPVPQKQPEPPQQQHQQQRSASQNSPQPVQPAQPKMYSPRPLPQPPQQPTRPVQLPPQQQQQKPPVAADPEAKEQDAEEEEPEEEEDQAAEAIEHADAVPDSPPSATAIPPPSRPIRYSSDPVVSLSPIVASSNAGLPPAPLALPASYTAGSTAHRLHVSQSASPPFSSSRSPYPTHSAPPVSEDADVDESEALSSSQRSGRSASLSVPSSPFVTPSPARNRGNSHSSALPVGATGSLRRSVSSQPPEHASPAQQQQQEPVRVLTHVDVIIVGAGLSGLTAASTLAEKGGTGLTVAILEASNRVGGRTLTKHVTISNTKGWSAPAAASASSTSASSADAQAAAAAPPPALPSSFNVQLDLGGQWVGPDHTALKALAARWDCALVAQHHAGTKIAQVRGEVHHYSGRLPSYLGVWGLVRLQMLIWKIDHLARSLHEATSVSAGGSGNLQDWDQCAYFDSMSCASWMSDSIGSSSLRRLFEAVVRGLFGLEPSEVSMLYLLADVSASGCSLERLIDIPGGNQESLFASGAQQLSEKMALACGFPGGHMESVHLWIDTPVRGVRMQPQQQQRAAGAAAGTSAVEETHPVEVIYERSGQSFVLRARHVILALAPVLYRHIAFTPALSVARRTLADRNVMGSLIKIVLLYARAFWREAGFSGEAFGDCWSEPPASGSSAGTAVESPIFQLYDGSKMVRPAVLDEAGREVHPEVLQPGLVVFINGQAALEWSARSAAERRTAVLRQLARWFATVDAPAGVTRVSSVEIGSPLYYEEQDWTREAWVRGCPIAGFPPGALWSSAHALHSPALGGRLQFAGTEESAVHTGFMEGAVRAGQRAAHAVLQDRKSRQTNKKAATTAATASASSDSTAATSSPRRSQVDQHGVDGAPASWVPTLVLIALLLLTVVLMLRAYALSLPPTQQLEFAEWIQQALWSALDSPFAVWRLWRSRESNDSAAASTLAPSCACSPSPL